jgi:hypothetical protein
VAIPANRAIVDALDERISASVYEVNGRIYARAYGEPAGSAEDRVRWFVLDATTFALLAEGDIGEAGFDYYQDRSPSIHSVRWSSPTTARASSILVG